MVVIMGEFKNKRRGKHNVKSAGIWGAVGDRYIEQNLLYTNSTPCRKPKALIETGKCINSSAFYPFQSLYKMRIVQQKAMFRRFAPLP
jgi:hypothetical protein